MKTHLKQTGSADFDFFVGEWRVTHTQLKRRLADSHEWAEFPGTCITRAILGGCANVDDNVIDHPCGPYRAATLRSFDAASGAWSIWWLDGRTPNRIDTPVMGRFDNGAGAFYADDTFEGKPIRVRFLWNAANPDRPVWQQAFSADGGQSWETNWVMAFERVLST